MVLGSWGPINEEWSLELWREARWADIDILGGGGGRSVSALEIHTVMKL